MELTLKDGDSKQFKNYSRRIGSALKIINNNKSIKIFGSGRTDSGVHDSSSSPF